jgi:hypothetical protein
MRAIGIGGPIAKCPRQGSAEAAVKHQPKHCQASPEDKTSSINRGHTHHNVPPAVWCFGTSEWGVARHRNR